MRDYYSAYEEQHVSDYGEPVSPPALRWSRRVTYQLVVHAPRDGGARCGTYERRGLDRPLVVADVDDEVTCRKCRDLARSTSTATSLRPDPSLTPENFAALGRVLRRGIEAGGREDFEAALRRKGRAR